MPADIYVYIYIYIYIYLFIYVFSIVRIASVQFVMYRLKIVTNVYMKL